MKIKIYTTPSCTYCYTLEEFLREKNIIFENIDISQDERTREEIIKKSGQMGVPVVEIGKKIIVGFDREKICKLLNIKN